VPDGEELNGISANLVNMLRVKGREITLFSPLFTRIRQKFSPFPVSCGITLDDGPEGLPCFVRAREKRMLFAHIDNGKDVESNICQPHLPDVVCIAATFGERKNTLFQSGVRLARTDRIPVIYTEVSAVLSALGLEEKDMDELPQMLRSVGFASWPEHMLCANTALTAITGYFFLNKEYEVVGKNVVPLLLDANPLFSLLRRIPYGEVATFREAAKALGLHWGEKELMKELERLPFGADVPAHRLVGKDGTLSRLFPGGVKAQRELLKWELIPFLDNDTVELVRAQWGRYKYKALTNYLRNITPEVRFAEVRFHEVEGIIGGLLPRAARRLGSWWRDEKPYSPIWMEAGWSVIGVNLQLEMVTFSRITQQR
jgi:alkylated DNA nucleotide flippase Atl1